MPAASAPTLTRRSGIRVNQPLSRRAPSQAPDPPVGPGQHAGGGQG